MIKLKSILESIDEMRYIFESPMRISNLDMDLLDNHDRNFAYAKIAKEKAKKIDSFDKYDVYQFNTKNTIHDVFIYGDFVVAFFSYHIDNNNFIEEKVWQEHLNMGLCRSILFEYYLNKHDRIISDALHTEYGERYWIKLLSHAIKAGYKVYVLKNNDEIKLDSIDDISKYFMDSGEGMKYRFVIEK